MGSTVSKEDINKYVIDNYEVAYNNCDDSYDFRRYFRNQALNNGINLDNETNKERLNEVLDSHIPNFEKRKSKDKSEKEKVDKLLKTVDEEREKNNRNTEILNEKLKMEKLERKEERKKFEEMQENLIQKFQNELKNNEKESRRREDNQLKVINELKEQRERSEIENRRREENQLRVINELKAQREKNERENKQREENQLKTIRELQAQRERSEKESQIREQNQLRVINELKEQRERSEIENKRREENHLKVINELQAQREKNERENKQREEKQTQIIEELKSQREKIEKESQIREQNQLNTIMQLQAQREKSDKENKEQIQKIQSKFNEQIQNLINQNNDNINSITDKYQKMILEANKKAEEEKKELEKKYKTEQNENKKKVNQEFDEKVENELESEINKLKEKFKKEEKNFCMENIKQFKLESLKNVIIALFIKEEIGKMIKESIKIQLIQLLDQPNRKVNHLNILVIGKTGAGKSSLINQMLRLDVNSDKKPEPGFMKPTTKGKPKYYDSEVVPFLRLADTQGIEISSKKSKTPYGIDEVERDVTEFIIEQNKSGNPDKYVHCIWYCFQPHDSRLQDDEEILLTNLSKNYSLETLPIILVGTKSNSQELVNQFKEEFEKCNYPFKFDFIPTLSKKMDALEPYGLDILQKQSIIKSMGAVKSKCYEGILEDVKTICLTNLIDKSKQIASNIQKYKDDCLKEISKGISINDLKTQIADIFITILNYFNNIILNENKIEGNKELKKESLEYLGKFIDDYFQNCLEGYYDCLIKFVDNNTKEIVNNILDFQNTFNNSHENLVYAKTTNQWGNLIRKRIIEQFIKIAEIYCNKNAFIYLNELLTHVFADAYFDTYKKIIDSKEEKAKDIDELIKNKIKSQFVDIQNKIDDYLNKLKEEEERKRKEEEERKRKEEEERKKKEEEEEKKRKDEELKNQFGKAFENGSLFSGVSLFS